MKHFILTAFWGIAMVPSFLIAQDIWADFNYPSVVVEDLGAGTSESAEGILNAIGNTESERTEYYNDKILKVVKRLYKNPSEVPNFTRLNLIFDPGYCGGIAAKSGAPPTITIENSTHYLNVLLEQSEEDLLTEFNGTLTHEVVHAYSHEPRNAGPYEIGEEFYGFIEGIADFVRLKEGYSTMADIVIDRTNKWTAGYNGSAFFINWLNNKYTDFAYELNKSCLNVDPWSFDAAIRQIVPGETAEGLWAEYVAETEVARNAGTLPNVDFEVNTTSIKMGETVNFTNLSSNALEYSWSFGGKSCVGGCSSENLNLTFDLPGSYNVSLAAKNFKGSRSKSVVINVESCNDFANVSSASSASSSSSERSEFDAEFAVDGSNGTRWSSEFSDDEWIALDLKKETEICAVGVRWFACCGFLMGAKNFEIQSSTDGNNWNNIETVNGNFDNLNYVPISVTTQYIRIKGIKRSVSNFGYSIEEILVYGENEDSYLFSDLTEPGGPIEEFNNDSPQGETIENLIDDNPSTKYLTREPTTTVTYTLQQRHIVTKYSLTSGNDASERDPKSWVLEGSNDGVTWVEIDRKSNQNFANRGERKVVVFSNEEAYSRYRFQFQNTSGNLFQLAELELFGKGPILNLNDTEESNLELIISPNPVTDKLNLTHNIDIQLLTVLDLYGRVLYQTSKDFTSINTTQYQEGTYLLSILTKKGDAVSSKFIVRK